MPERQPAYQLIYHNLLKAIKQQCYPVGSRLPTEQELCGQYGVSRITSKHALDMLAQEGLISRSKGRGSIVIRDPNAAPASRDDGRILGLVIPDFSETFGIQMLYGFEQACADNDCAFALKRSRGDLMTERRAIDDLLKLGAAGIAVMPLHGEYYNESILKPIIEGFPIVILDRRYPGINGSFVGTDNLEAAALAAEHLIQLGHRTIAWVSPEMIQTSTLQDRVQGFTDAMARRGLSSNRGLWYTNVKSTLPLRNTPKRIDEDVKRLAEHLRAHPEITAVFAAEYNIAVLVERAARVLGLDIPGDLSLICFDAPMTFEARDAFTHIRQREKQIGREAVGLLLHMIQAGGEDGIQKITLPGELVIGKSTAPPPKKGGSAVRRAWRIEED